MPDTVFGGNAINYFDLGNADTRLSFYLRTSVASVKDTSVINFTFTCLIRRSKFCYSRTEALPKLPVILHILPAGDSLIYIQTAPGSYAELKIPGFTGLSNRIIHRAELIVDQAYSPSLQMHF